MPDPAPKPLSSPRFPGLKSRTLDDQGWHSVALALADGVPVGRVADWCGLSRGALWRARRRCPAFDRLCRPAPAPPPARDDDLAALRGNFLHGLELSIRAGDIRALLRAADLLGISEADFETIRFDRLQDVAQGLSPLDATETPLPLHPVAQGSSPGQPFQQGSAQGPPGMAYRSRRIVRQAGHSRDLRKILRGQGADIFRTRESSLELHLPWPGQQWQAG